MTLADRSFRQEALMSLNSLAVPIHEAGQAVGQIREELSAAQELIDDAESAPEALSEALKALTEELDEVAEELGEARQNAGVAGAIQGSSTRPTEDHVWQVDRAWELMPGVIARLNELIRIGVPELNAQLYAEGVRPADGEEIEMPER